MVVVQVDSIDGSGSCQNRWGLPLLADGGGGLVATPVASLTVLHTRRNPKPHDRRRTRRVDRMMHEARCDRQEAQDEPCMFNAGDSCVQYVHIYDVVAGGRDSRGRCVLGRGVGVRMHEGSRHRERYAGGAGSGFAARHV